ncbi:calcium-binding protein [Streptomyces sp. NPDC008092]|uniref:calcium-binding protein n=1 Tax=Streptomyces sp. NPDC008092 TaxID=3364808 RepID=UPI0036F0E14C
MRRRCLTTALTGALALSALTTFLVPAAHADGNTTITDVVVNGGHGLALGATAPKSFPVSVTAQDNSGIREMNLHVRLPSYLYKAADRGLTCTAVSATTTSCTGSWTVDTSNFYGNGPADDSWYVEAYVYANDGDWVSTDRAATFTVRRLAKLTANAAPEPVAKNATLTVTGKLTRADWSTHKYAGYAGRSVKLQFRKAGTSTYTTVKTVTTGRGGALKTTAKAKVDGYWRWYYGGDSTTSTAGATGDYVDVR